jgi:hypothetical protein
MPRKHHALEPRVPWGGCLFALLVTRKVPEAHPAAIVRMAQIQRKQILNH